MTGTLYLVATPIGNLADISRRALETLETADFVACEDTRHTGKLLHHFGISKRLLSYHEHNEHERAGEIARLLFEGKSIALVSDAGTPGISDPAFRAVRAAREVGARIVPIPGAVAFVSALIVSGLPTDSIFFGGFLPSKKNERRSRLAEVKAVPATMIFYETPHRLAKSLVDCLEILGDRSAVVARELTKLHEEIIAGSLRELTEKFSNLDVKGEIVLVIDRTENSGAVTAGEGKTLEARVRELEAEGFDTRAAMKRAAKEFGLTRSEAYRRLIPKK